MIAILMATYNGEKYLTEQIDSIINQTCKDWKLYFRDDGSNDRTVDIINKYCEEYPDKLFLIKDNLECKSASKNFIQMLNYISGFEEFDYFMFSDQDDVWKEDKIEKTLTIIEQENNEVPILVHTDLEVVDSELKTLSKSFITYRNLDVNKKDLSHLLIQNNVTGCTMMFNRKLLEKINSNSNCIAMHDWWLTLIAATFGKIKFLNESTIYYRQHSNNVVGATKATSLSFIINRLFHSNHVKKTLNMSIEQAIVFYNEYKNDITKQQRAILEKFILIKNSNKLKKIYIIIKNNFLKQGLIQIIGELIYI